MWTGSSTRTTIRNVPCLKKFSPTYANWGKPVDTVAIKVNGKTLAVVPSNVKTFQASIKADGRMQVGLEFFEAPEASGPGLVEKAFETGFQGG